MKLYEYQARRILSKYGVPVPDYDVATTSTEARRIAQRLDGPVVIKAQVLVFGRGKAGGIKFAHDADEAEVVAEQILGMTLKGCTVDKVLVDRAIDIQKELYLAIVLDRASCSPVLIASSEGGVEIEEVARTQPEHIFKLEIDPVYGLADFQARNLAFDVGLQRIFCNPFVSVAQGLYQALIQNDAMLVEINPLVITGDQQLLAVDSKITLDDSALFRHKDMDDLRDAHERTDPDRLAAQAGVSYVKLDGEIGCMVNGAGLAMATMDIIKLHGGEPANFLDIGGGAKAEKVAAALRIILSDANVKSVLLNIFGGITRCDEVARGILEALNEVQTQVPMVARLVGTNEEEGHSILADSPLETAESLVEAAKKAVALAQERTALNADVTG
jgi:succinyl-CoA synthetase beta subunit